ncbi:MAG: ABC transporter ATP-binding protein [Fusobacterium sp.]|nr:ABC transporter ATP-binding protein [Fusobacterium sp.]
MLKIKNLNVILKKQKNKILKNINFEMKTGELVGIVGESGCGKTTFINAISSFCDEKKFNLEGEIFLEKQNLLDEKKEGKPRSLCSLFPFSARLEVSPLRNSCKLVCLEVLRCLAVGGRVQTPKIKSQFIIPLDKKKKDKRREICTKNMSVILQDSINTLNPYEKLKTQLLEEYTRIYGKQNTKEKLLEKITKDLKDIGLKNIEIILNSYPNELSGGMKQRISIVLALCNNSIKLLLADEPTTSLDVINQVHFIRLLKEICVSKKISLIYVSHDIRLLSQICDRIIVMQNGEILEDNSTGNILKNPQNEYTKLLIDAFNFFEE